MEVFTDTNQNFILLAVMAHPDDESFGIGGTLAFYGHQDVDVHLVCATHGEAGEADDSYLQGHSSMYALREAELRCAAGILGLSGVHFLGYRDSGMQGSKDNNHPGALAATPLSQVTHDIVQIIRQLKPDVVVTFDPIGGYRHPDHIVVHQAATRAFFAAGDPDQVVEGFDPHQAQKLYYSTMPRGLLKIGVRILRLIGRDPSRFGKNQDVDLASIAEITFPKHAVINYRSVSKLRDQASACHASQGGKQITGGIIGWIRRLFLPRETFMRAYPPPDESHIERDLFEGFVKEGAD